MKTKADNGVFPVQAALRKVCLFCETDNFALPITNACQNKNERSPHFQVTCLAERPFCRLPEQETMPYRI